MTLNDLIETLSDDISFEIVDAMLNAINDPAEMPNATVAEIWMEKTFPEPKLIIRLVDE